MATVKLSMLADVDASPAANAAQSPSLAGPTEGHTRHVRNQPRASVKISQNSKTLGNTVEGFEVCGALEFRIGEPCKDA